MDHYPAQHAPPGFGNMASVPRFPLLVNRGCQAGVADKLLCRGETLDVSNLRQNGEGGQHVNAGNAEKQLNARYKLGPPVKFLLQGLNLFL